MAREPRGSVLLLLPAAVVVFAVLGALAVDFGGAYAAERKLADAAAGAANDVATKAIDLDRFYETGEIVLLPALAWDVADRSVAAKGLDRLDARVTAVDVDGNSVVVEVSGRSPYLFAEALPGGPDGLDVSASSRVTAESP